MPAELPYDRIGHDYGTRRRADPRIARVILDALGPARRVLNVGAGTGSYEPHDRTVVAVEPSALMIAQRPTTAAPVVQAVAEALPFPDGSFDAGLSILSAHHWQDMEAGLREMRRVARDRIVLLAFEPDAQQSFSMIERYLPEFGTLDRQRFAFERLSAILGPLQQTAVPIPADCTDGFFGAYWRRPEAYLDPSVRNGISTFHLLDPALVAQRMQWLAQDLASGEWDRRYGHLRRESALDIGYSILVASCT